LIRSYSLTETFTKPNESKHMNEKPKATSLPSELKNVLMLIGRGLGTVSVYGTRHPSVDQIVGKTFKSLQKALKNRESIAIGSFHGSLTVDDEPITAREVPIRTLEKRIIAMKISHLTLHAGLSQDELKQLLAALCSPSDIEMKEALSGSGLEHVELEDVKYVILREGEEKTGKGGALPEPVEIPPAQVSQIVAFLKGAASDKESIEGIKKALSDPEKLGQIIMEAAAIRQAGIDVQSGESLADIVIGCLRRTYDGLRKEKEFKSIRGKTNLSKAMMLLEKNVLDKIHKALGKEHPEIDDRILDAIREMETEHEFNVLSAHYFAQNKKMQKAEGQMIEAIQSGGAEKAQEQFESSDIAPKDWQRLMVQAGAEPAGKGGGGGAPEGLDMSALAVVLQKLENLMEMENWEPAQVEAELETAKNRLTTYTDQIELRIEELEGQVCLDDSTPATLEDHADKFNRDELMMEVSNLTLALVQPLTVINASVEAAMRQAGEETRKDLLDLAHMSGQRMQALAKRLMILVGYPTLEKTLG